MDFRFGVCFFTHKTSQRERIMRKTYGYMRLSPGEQRESSYLAMLTEAGVQKEQVYIDRISGTDSECAAFRCLVRDLESDDMLFVVSLNHLGKNSEEVKEHWQIITKDCGSDLAVLDMPLLDTRQDENIKDLVVQIFEEISKIRKSYSHQRQIEGIKKAKERNVSFGRHTKPIPKDFKKVADMYDKKQISARSAAERLNVSPKTFLKWYRNRGETIRNTHSDIS